MRAIARDPAMTLFENEIFTIEHAGMTPFQLSVIAAYLGGELS
jgi:hypothetical protein